MVRTSLKWMAVVIALTAVASSAQADFITFVNNTNSAGGAVNSVTVTGTGDAFPIGTQVTTAPIAATSFVDIDLNVLKLHTSFQSNFTVTNTGPPKDQTQYLFRITIHNLANIAFPAFKLTLAGTGSAFFNTAFNAIDVGNSTDPINNTPGAFSWDNTQGNSNPSGKILDFGGLQGGGSQLAAGGTTIVNAFVYVQKGGGVGTTGTFNLQFVANPEPGTLLLAALSLGGLCFYQIRRRNQLAAVIS